jgi:hypothetical protein
VQLVAPESKDGRGEGADSEARAGLAPELSGAWLAPELAMVIHLKGRGALVHAVAWCPWPGGARGLQRLGVLAVASSSGHVVLVSVPLPPVREEASGKPGDKSNWCVCAALQARSPRELSRELMRLFLTLCLEPEVETGRQAASNPKYRLILRESRLCAFVPHAQEYCVSAKSSLTTTLLRSILRLM